MTTYAPVAALLALVALCGLAFIARDILRHRRAAKAWRQRPWPGRDGDGGGPL